MNRDADMKRTAALYALAATCAVSQAAEPLAPVAWLQGCWASEGGERGSGEQWSAPAGGVMIGAGRTIRGGKIALLEFLQLKEIDGKLSYVVFMPGGKEVAFTLRDGGTPAGLVFENEAHDFPQRIIYRKLEAQRLHARIEGTVKGKLQAVDFPMKRASCEG